MEIDLTQNVQQIVAALAEQRDALPALLEAIERAHEWEPDFDRRLDAVYRTRLRHLFVPRQHTEALSDFARHLNIAATLIRSHSPALSSRLGCYEAVVNDAVDEIDGGWLDVVLRKKHVAEILAFLTSNPQIEFSADDLRAGVALEPANLSRRLGLMESAGLIARRYDGPHLRVRATDLGRRMARPHPPESSRILSLGFSERGAFVDLVTGDGACIVERQTGLVSLSEALFPAFKGGIKAHQIARFGVFPKRNDGTAYELYLDLVEPRQRVSLGIWVIRTAFQELLDWVSNANSELECVRSQAETFGQSKDLLNRVIKRKQLLWVPGHSLSAAQGSRMSEYHEGWMDLVVTRLEKSLRDYAGLQELSSSRERWPERFTWETVFDYILGVKRFEPKESVDFDLCFEFLYVDDLREGRYDLVEVGTLSTCQLIMHKRNDRLSAFNSAFTDALVNKTSKGPAQESIKSRSTRPLTFAEFDQFVSKVGHAIDEFADSRDQLRGRPWTFCSNTGTICASLITDLITHERIDFDKGKLHKLTAGCVDELKNDAHSVVLLCDNVIAKDFMAAWKDTGPGAEKDLRFFTVEYPAPVKVGIGVPKGQPEWKALLHAALLNVIHSEAGRVSWQGTLADLDRIGVRVDEDFKLTREFQEARV